MVADSRAPGAVGTPARPTGARMLPPAANIPLAAARAPSLSFGVRPVRRAAVPSRMEGSRVRIPPGLRSGSSAWRAFHNSPQPPGSRALTIRTSTVYFPNRKGHRHFHPMTRPHPSAINRMRRARASATVVSRPVRRRRLLLGIRSGSTPVRIPWIRLARESRLPLPNCSRALKFRTSRCEAHGYF